jgi:hypothetical protein
MSPRSRLVRTLALLTTGLLATACEPFVTAPGDDARPAVVTVRLRDTLAFLDSSSLSSAELAALPRELGPGVIVQPFQHPRVVFNKLMDGDSLEQVERDPTTGLLVGNCRPQPGVYELVAGGDPVPDLLACYDPSLRQAIVIPKGGEDPRPFLRYDTTYTLRVTAAARDKLGQALTPFEVSFTTGPFAIFSVSDAGGETHVLGAAAREPQALPAGTEALRLVFTGPVDSGEVAALLDAEATVSSLPGGEPLAARFSPGEDDPRVMLLSAPFAPGHYRVTLPAAMSDTGAVTGAPQALGAEVAFELEVREP